MTDKKQGRVTIKDIAQRTGVSKTTVSFVFNNPDRVAPKTRRTVLAAAAEMGYTPDPVARTLTTKRTGTLGFLLPEVTPEGFKNPFLFLLLQGMRIGCMSNGYTLNVLSPPASQVLETVQNTAMDGLIILGVVHDTAFFSYLNRRGLPAVSLDGGVLDTIPTVRSRDDEASREVLRKVLEAGHRRILFLTVDTGPEPKEGFSASVSDLRQRGWREAAEAAGLSWNGENIRTALCRECSMEGGREAFEESWNTGFRPTAVVCFSDIIAVGVFEACRAREIRIPTDLSLVGFDDIQEGQLLEPPLTTVHQPATAKGQAAVNMLAALIRGEPVYTQYYTTHYLSRGSLAQAPS